MRAFKEAFDEVKETHDDNDTTCTLSCNRCAATFTVDFDLLHPKHVQYNLSERTARVECPNCGNEGAAGEQEVQAEQLRTVLEDGEQRLRAAAEAANIKFVMTKQPDRTTPFRSAEFDCIACGTSFEVRTGGHPEGRLNCKDMGPGKDFTLFCPGCGAEDTVGPSNARERMHVIYLGQICKELRAHIAKLEGTEDGTEEATDEGGEADSP